MVSVMLQAMTQAEFARHRGVSREAVRKMIVTGKIPFREENGKKLIDPAAADLALGANIARVLADDVEDEAPGKGEPTKPGLTAARTRTEEYRADLAALELQQRLGKLRPVEDFTVATQRCAEAAIRTIDRITGRAEDCAAIVAKEGAAGARSFLRGMARDLRKMLADEFAKLASGELVKEVERDAAAELAE